jgi:alpha-tubulin suppressor-like RCC1 family protein
LGGQRASGLGGLSTAVAMALAACGSRSLPFDIPASSSTQDAGTPVDGDPSVDGDPWPRDVTPDPSPDAPSSVDGGPESPVSEFALGGSFTCALLKQDARVSCWGFNGSGELGDGSTTTRANPAVVSGLLDVAQVEAGESHACALLGDGSVWCWGANDLGQLGDGTAATRLAPVAVSGLSGAVRIALGNQHSCALLSGGNLMCWGSNWAGQLGNGASTDFNQSTATPAAVSGLTSVLSEVVGLGLGRDHSCALGAGGNAACWGYNGMGQLGVSNLSQATRPLPVVDLTGARQIAVSSDHSCALLGDGSARCWGDTFYDQLWDGGIQQSPFPLPIQGLSGAVELGLGGHHACAKLGDRTLVCWGLNNYGQLGRGNIVADSAPGAVHGLSEVDTFGLGARHACASLRDGSVRCWGANDFGQLGHGNRTDSELLPVTVEGLL